MYSTEALLVDQSPALEPLLSTYPFKPYQAYEALFGRDALQKLFIDSVRDRIGSADTRTLVIRDTNRSVGLVVWTRVPLESQWFGFPAARLDYLMAAGDYPTQCRIKEHLLEAMLKQCTSDGVRHVSIRADAADLSNIHTLEKAGFILVDGLIAYGRDLQRGDWAVPNDLRYRIRHATPADLSELIALASTAYTFDRLHSDPAVPKAAADRMHAVWLENSLGPKSTDQVLLAIDTEGIAGYSVYRISQATQPYFSSPWGIWVIAATAERARGTGVAKTLCLTMLDWHRKQGVRIVEGGTQLANVASARLHESCGFRVVSTSVSLSKYIEVNP